MTPGELRRALDRLQARTRPSSSSGVDHRERIKAMFVRAIEGHERYGGWQAHDPAELADAFTDHLGRVVAEVDAVRDEINTTTAPVLLQRLKNREGVLVFIAGRLANGADRALNDRDRGRPVIEGRGPIPASRDLSTVDLIALAECR